MKKYISVIIIGLMLSMCFIVNPVSSENTISVLSGNTLYVGGTGDNNYTTIQDAIDNATSGDTVFVYNGTYFENVEINTDNISLIGEDKNTTIIDDGGGLQVIHVIVDNVYISNLTIRNSGGYKDNAGIRLDSNNNLIKNCILYRTKTGIYLDEAENNIISNCFFHTNGEGIYFKETSKNMINNCQFCHNAFGINLQNSDHLTINTCYIHTNGIGIYGKGSGDSEITHCSVSDNNQDGGGIWLFDCKNFDIKDCNINHNGAGIKLENSDSTISHCNLHWNMYHTMKVKNSENTVISNCDIRNSFRTAIIVKESHCILKNNNIVGNGLYALKYDSYFCNARKNWWGSITGPSYINSLFGDRISIKKMSFKLVPWSLKPYDDAGTTWDTKDVFSKLEIPSERFKPIEFNEEDTDGDGCPDWWEKKWNYDPMVWDDHNVLDPDDDGLNNVEECYTDSYGSDPFYKDIFVEVDWIESKDTGVTNKPPENYIDKAKNVFKEHKINLHIDVGNLGGGEEIPIRNKFNTVDLRDLYWDYFLHNNLDNPRKGIFHYTLVLTCIEELYGGFVFLGWDNLDTSVLNIQETQNNNKDLERGHLIISGLMHELGHTLGLIVDDYDGIDNDESYVFMRKSYWKYRNYISCMNYRYIYEILDYSDGTHGHEDFNDWGNLDLSYFKNTHLEWPQ